MTSTVAPARIVVTGSESTGKTTLARDLASALGGSWIPEFARSYAESVARPLTANDVEPIARGQIQAMDQTLALIGAPLVFDTDLISTVVYARHYYGRCPAWIVDEAHRRRSALYLLCDIDLPWRPDAIRDRGHQRAQLHAVFQNTLDEFGVPVTPVSGIGPARLDAALHEIAHWRAGRG